MTPNPKYIVEAKLIDPFYLPNVKFYIHKDKVWINPLPVKGEEREWRIYKPDTRRITAEQVKELITLYFKFDKVLEEI